MTIPGQLHMINYNHTAGIELAVAAYFDYRRNIVVPNVWWGFGLNHECDLLVMTGSGYCYEVEIKVSRSDLKADQKKRYGHASNKIRKLYFAIPTKLTPHVNLVPDRAGILIVGDGGYIRKHREAKPNQFCKQLGDKERAKLLTLGCMRIWKLKRIILDNGHPPTDFDLGQLL